MNTYTVELKEDPDDPESLILEFPEDVLSELGWAPADTLIWELQEDNTIILKKR